MDDWLFLYMHLLFLLGGKGFIARKDQWVLGASWHSASPQHSSALPPPTAGQICHPMLCCEINPFIKQCLGPSAFKNYAPKQLDAAS